jgi:alkylation response protein AidB-like acyl-CoA dehydrogenase
MEFGLSEEQRMLQHSVSGFLEANMPLERVRELASEGAAHDDASWRALAELGIAGVLVAEEYGGMGMTLLDAMLVQEALGRQVAPLSFTATSVMAALAIGRAGNEAQRQQWLPGIADGSLQFAVGVSEHAGAREGGGIVASG